MKCGAGGVMRWLVVGRKAAGLSRAAGLSSCRFGNGDASIQMWVCNC